MELLQYTIEKKALRGVTDRASQAVLERVIYKELKEDLEVITSFDSKASLLAVNIKNEYVIVKFQVSEQRFTFADYKILKTLIFDDVSFFIK